MVQRYVIHGVSFPLLLQALPSGTCSQVAQYTLTFFASIETFPYYGSMVRG
jgi:hypothetical protein